MPTTDHSDHHLITVYADCEQGLVERLVNNAVQDKNTRVLCPTDPDALLQAAKNSSLIIICLNDAQDQNIRIARYLKEERGHVAEIIAVLREGDIKDVLKVQANGFALCVPYEHTQSTDFEKLFRHRVREGGKRLTSILVEEEFRQFSEALSSSPVSIIVFDHEKRIVFVSEHYYRAYPKSAPRLVRGLSVYEAFEMMSDEEELLSKDPEDLEVLKRFWYSLSGDVEFTLKNHRTYHSRAVPLTGERGTIVTTQNITPYIERAEKLEKVVNRLRENEKSKAG